MRLVLLAALWLGCTSTVAASTTILQIDAEHSQASFAVQSRWFVRITGTFTAVNGRILLDADGAASVDAWIDLGQLQMDNEDYRAELESPAFFDRAKYPLIHFRSAPLPQDTLGTGGTIVGWLTMHGQTRKVHFTLLPDACIDVTQPDCIVRLHGTILRSLFGMHAHHFLLSDHVQLNLQIRLNPGAPA